LVLFFGKIISVELSAEQQTITYPTLGWRAYLKLSFIIVWILLFLLIISYLIISIWIKNKPIVQNVILISPMKFTKFTGLGNVSEPLVNLKLKTNDGYKNYDFLLDSGAVISSLCQVPVFSTTFSKTFCS